MQGPGVSDNLSEVVKGASRSESLLTIIVLVLSIAGLVWVLAKYILPELVKWQEQKTRQAEAQAVTAGSVKSAAEAVERTAIVQKTMLEAQERLLKMCECEHERWRVAADDAHGGE